MRSGLGDETQPGKHRPTADGLAKRSLLARGRPRGRSTNVRAASSAQADGRNGRGQEALPDDGESRLQRALPSLLSWCAWVDVQPDDDNSLPSCTRSLFANAPNRACWSWGRIRTRAPPARSVAWRLGSEPPT